MTQAARAPLTDPHIWRLAATAILAPMRRGDPGLGFGVLVVLTGCRSCCQAPSMSGADWGEESFLEFNPDNDVVPPGCGVGRMMRLEEREPATSGMCWHDFLLVG